MGLRFRKSIRIIPGVKLNFNKKSTSVTAGGRGIKHTVNSSGRRTSSIGIPGTGISYSTSSKKQNTNANSGIAELPSQNVCKVVSYVSLILFVISLFTFIWFASELIRRVELIYVLPACLFGGVSVKLFVLYRRYAKIRDWYEEQDGVISEENEFFSEDSIALEAKRREQR